MKKTIEDLYFGQIQPCERNPYKSAEYKKAVSEVQSARDKLLKKLNTEEKQLFANYQEKESLLFIREEFSIFLEGFQLATKLLLEAIGYETVGTC